jgi:pimeloyl-ACP methyl ester carboxylesterase
MRSAHQPPAGQPLILLRGIARHARTFGHLAPHFSQDCHVIAVDMRGHGDSEWDPQGNYLVEDYYRDVEALAAQLGLRNVRFTRFGDKP